MITEISLDQFLRDLRSAQASQLPGSYAWVLGAGAAATSQIPTGDALARHWFKELSEDRDPTTISDLKALSQAGLNPADPASFYGQLYKLRYSYRPKLGQEFLRKQILGRTPSYGYGALAQIQTESSHRHVVTTNFDHLLEEAHRRYLNRELIVCGSDDQAATVQRLPDQPLLGKIHGDIFHETKSDASYIAELREIWFDPLRTLFNRNIPLFVGYGGNDPGFMKFLTQGVRAGWFPDKPVWTYREKNGVPTGQLLRDFGRAHDILLVPIPGFDEFLFLFAEALDLKPLTKRLEADFASRVRAYQDSYDQMAAALRAARPADAHPGGPLDRSLAPAEKRTWWEWTEAARNAPTYREGRQILEAGIESLPQSLELRSYYAEYRAEANPRDADAEAIARAALKEAERQYGTEHPSTLTCIRHLAVLLARKGDGAEAERLYRRALEAQERVLGADHPDTLKCINHLAVLLAAKGDPTSAEPLYRRALETRERTLGPDHPDTLTSVDNLARRLVDKGDRARAEQLYRRAVESRERVLGLHHPDTLISVRNLASLLTDTGELDAAEPLLRRVLETQESTLGLDHPETLKTVSSLAILLGRKGERNAAEPLYRRALESRERIFGPDHPETLASLNNLANLLLSHGDQDAAEPLYRRALEAQERVLGPEHPDTVKVANNLAFLLTKKGDLAGAAALRDRTGLQAGGTPPDSMGHS